MQVTNNQNRVGFTRNSLLYDKPTLSVLPRTFRNEFKNVIKNRQVPVNCSSLDIIPRDANPNLAGFRATVTRKLGEFASLRGEDFKGVNVNVNNGTSKNIVNAIKESIQNARKNLKENLDKMIKSKYPTKEARDAARSGRRSDNLVKTIGF